MFDNVGKKLQQSINDLLKIAPPSNPAPKINHSRANSRASREGPPSSHHINYQDLNQQPLRQSSAHSVDKNKNSVIKV